MTDFPKGIFAKAKHPNAPDFVLGKINIKVNEAIEYLKEVEGEWLNLDLKKNKDGKLYLQVDNWKPKSESNRYLSHAT